MFFLYHDSSNSTSTLFAVKFRELPVPNVKRYFGADGMLPFFGYYSCWDFNGNELTC